MASRSVRREAVDLQLQEQRHAMFEAEKIASIDDLFGQTVKGILSVIRGLCICEPYLSSDFLKVLYLYVHCLEYLYSLMYINNTPSGRK